jgi:hypothetical protein
MRFICAAVLLASVCLAQTSQPPATPDELQYLRFVLLNVASIDHHPNAIKTFEDLLVKQFGLNAQESAAIHAQGQVLRLLLVQHRSQRTSTMAGSTSPTNAQFATLAQLDAEREQKISDLANQLLTSVRPITATRLRNAGHIAASAVTKN